MIGADGDGEPVGPPLRERHRAWRGDAARRMQRAIRRARERDGHRLNLPRLHVLQANVVYPELRRVGREPDAHLRPRRVERRDERQRERVLAQFGDEGDGRPRSVERARRNRLTVDEYPWPASRLPHAHGDRPDIFCRGYHQHRCDSNPQKASHLSAPVSERESSCRPSYSSPQWWRCRRRWRRCPAFRASS